MKYNELYMRNTRPDFWEDDSNIYRCNCGSFALNLTTWFAPYLYESEIEDMDDDDAFMYGDNEREHYFKDLLEEGYDREDVMASVIEKDWEFILKTCPFLKPIRADEINDTDRIIAYRLMLEEVDAEDFDTEIHTDFHFRVCIDGEWWEKNGSGPIHSCGRFADESPWHCADWVYDSEVKYAKFVS